MTPYASPINALDSKLSHSLMFHCFIIWISDCQCQSLVFGFMPEGTQATGDRSKRKNRIMFRKEEKLLRVPGFQGAEKRSSLAPFDTARSLRSIQPAAQVEKEALIKRSFMQGTKGNFGPRYKMLRMDSVRGLMVRRGRGGDPGRSWLPTKWSR